LIHRVQKVLFLSKSSPKMNSTVKNWLKMNDISGIEIFKILPVD